MLKVPFAALAVDAKESRAATLAALTRVYDSGVYIGGPEVAAFEAALASVVEAAHVIGVSSGTDALLSLAMALPIAPGATVVTTPFSFMSTASSFVRAGARVIFADIDRATANLCPRAAANGVDARTCAIVTVNLFGLPAELPQVTDVPVIEDAAQSIGACGLRGRAATYSFFPTKNLGAIGDAGAVVTNDAALAERVRLVRNHGAQPKYHHVMLGGNFRLDALQAAVLAARLDGLAAATARRRANAAVYRELIAALGWPAEVQLPPADPTHVYHQFVVFAPRRDALRAHLASQDIASEIYYPHPLHLAPALAALGYRAGAMPNAEWAAAHALALPIAPRLTLAQQEHVVTQVARFYQG